MKQEIKKIFSSDFLSKINNQQCSRFDNIVYDILEDDKCDCLCVKGYDCCYYYEVAK